MPDHAPPIRDEVIAMEKRYWNAVQAKDGEKAAQLSGEPALVAGPYGVMRIPSYRMGAMAAESDWTLDSYELDDIEVSIPSPDVAVIAYTLNRRITIDGEQQNMRAADCSTWVRGADGWKCCAHTETLLDDA